MCVLRVDVGLNYLWIHPMPKETQRTNQLPSLTRAMALFWPIAKVLCFNLAAVLGVLIYEFYLLRENYIRRACNSDIEYCMVPQS